MSIQQQNHRSKKRISELGEVFTPEKYVEEMLDTIAPSSDKVWADTSVQLLEPTCGHGNIVIALVKRRLEAIYNAAHQKYKTEAAYFSVANTINSIWAIDIDETNIEECRQRVLSELVSFIQTKNKKHDINFLLEKRKDFIGHLICAIMWHIHENEALSALTKEEEAALKEGYKTKSGKKWLLENGHRPIDFNKTWVDFYRECEERKLIPLEYEKAISFIDNRMSGNKEFAFAEILL